MLNVSVSSTTVGETWLQVCVPTCGKRGDGECSTMHISRPSFALPWPSRPELALQKKRRGKSCHGDRGWGPGQVVAGDDPWGAAGARVVPRKRGGGCVWCNACAPAPRRMSEVQTPAVFSECARIVVGGVCVAVVQVRVAVGWGCVVGRSAGVCAVWETCPVR